MTENIFLQISILLALTVSIAFIMRLLRQPLIVAYIVAGLIAGPLFLNSYGEGAFFGAFAQFGIVLLLFVVGLSLNFSYIQRVGKTVLVGGIVQFVVTVILGLALMYGLGFSLFPALFIAVATTFSSTIIVMKLLSDKRDLETVYGRYVTGVLLFQDIIAVGILIFLNTSKLGETLWYDTLVLTLGKGLILIAIVYLMAKYVLPMLMDRVAQSSEFLFIFTIAWCFGVASLVYWFGFSMEIGAVIAGISLGASTYQREIASRVRPLRDFFLVLFFIVLGSELRLTDMGGALVPGILLSLFVLVFDPIILYMVMRMQRYTRRTAFLAGITSAQISEFGFILAFKGREVGYLQGNELEILTIVALITIVISSYLIEYNEAVYRAILPFLNLFGKDHHQPQEGQEGEVGVYRVWVFGYHRIGWKVCEALKEKKISFAVVDFNPEAIAKAQARGIPAFFGDAADVEFLASLSLDQSELVLSTLPEADDQITLIKHVRHLSDKIFIIANLYHKGHLEDLYAAGAHYVMMPHLLGGSWIAHVLKHKPWSKRVFQILRKEQKEEMQLRFTGGVE